MSENVTSTTSASDLAGPGGSPGRRTVGPSGRYVLGPLLGRGGMADVYRAHDQTLGRDVAVKLLRERTPDPTDRARFVTEAQTLARLNHPNLVTILDAGFSDEHPFLVLELVVGSSLAGTLTQAGEGLPPERVTTIGAQIAAALAHCHAAGVVHRDVKPGNILLGEGGRALLTDFGISRLLDGSTHHTKTGFTIGTASYLAPEQVYGDVLTPAVDMYALGLVLLEACTARREYTGTPVEAGIARLHRSPRIPVDLPPSLAQVLAALTRTDPGSRPDAGETAQRLTSGPSPAGRDVAVSNMAVSNMDITNARDTATEPTRLGTTRASRHRRPLVLALLGWAVAAAAVMALAVILSSRPSKPPEAPAGSAPRPVQSASASAKPSTRAATAVERAPASTSSRPATSASRPSSRRSTTRHRAEPHAPAPAHGQPGKTRKPAKHAKHTGHRGGKGR